ncbi:MAG: PGF-pre-PGF domain-containing protein, partial [Nanohaloarchaea archaeon]|nr:PGF-pre-PGF domain-containing protein [Candidatus Nanohaloarchaea archaeon]
MILLSKEKKPNKSSNSRNVFDFTVSISSYLNDAIYTPENVWATVMQKIIYADQFITMFNKNNYCDIINLNNKKIYDIEKHKRLIDSCKTYLGKKEFNCLRDIKYTKASINFSKILETTELNDSAKKELNTLFKYETLMFNAANQLKQKSDQNQLNAGATYTNKKSCRTTQTQKICSNQRNTFNKTASIALTGPLVLAGFGALIDIDHNDSTNNIDTIYQNILSQLDSIQPKIPDLIPKASASSDSIDNKEISNAYITVEITPQNNTIHKNENFHLNVFVSDITEPIVGMQANIVYDSSAITINDIYEGDLFTQDGASTFFVDDTKDDTAGIRKNIYTSIMGDYNVNTPENFITINITAKDTLGKSDINLENVIISNTQGQAVPYTINNGIVTIYDATTSSTNPTNNKDSSGGGGGGGGGSAGEVYENIIFKDVLSEQIINGEETTYKFDDPENPINYLKFISSTNKGPQNLNIQVLEELSALVGEEPANGIIGKYFNMYLGLVGTDNGLEDISLEFALSEETMKEK